MGVQYMGVQYLGLAATVVLVAALLGKAYLTRTRCPYRDPLCRRNRPCLRCYRDLYKDSVDKGPDQLK